MSANLSAKVQSHYAEQARLARLNTLQRKLADSAARSDIECCCDRTDDGRLYDARAMEPENEQAVAEAIEYLELRGLIVREPHGFVRFVERQQ